MKSTKVSSKGRPIKQPKKFGSLEEENYQDIPKIRTVQKINRPIVKEHKKVTSSFPTRNQTFAKRVKSPTKARKEAKETIQPRKTSVARMSTPSIYPFDRRSLFSHPDNNAPEPRNRFPSEHYKQENEVSMFCPNHKLSHELEKRRSEKYWVNIDQRRPVIKRENRSASYENVSPGQLMRIQESKMEEEGQNLLEKEEIENEAAIREDMQLREMLIYKKQSLRMVINKIKEGIEELEKELFLKEQEEQ